MIKHAKILISGRVQGVFFRAYTQEEAKRIGLTGVVRNLNNGSVEVEAEGTREQIDELVKWCHSGSPLARVDHVEVTTKDDLKGYFGFEITR